MKNIKTLNQFIQYRRIQTEMTQKELASRINVNPITISKYERGKRYPSIEKLIKIARALDTPFIDFLNFDISAQIGLDLISGFKSQGTLVLGRPNSKYVIIFIRE